MINTAERIGHIVAASCERQMHLSQLVANDPYAYHTVLATSMGNTATGKLGVVYLSLFSPHEEATQMAPPKGAEPIN